MDKGEKRDASAPHGGMLSRVTAKMLGMLF